MSILEQKLIELGYEECAWEKGKWDSKTYAIILFTNEEVTKIEDYYVWSNQIRFQPSIDFIQASFNQMQKDLAILKGSEDED